MHIPQLVLDQQGLSCFFTNSPASMVCPIIRLGDGFIRATRAVREQVVDDQASNREEEDKQAPENLVNRWAVGLQYLHEDNDIQDKDNEPDYSTSSTKLPSIAMALSRDLVG